MHAESIWIEQKNRPIDLRERLNYIYERNFLRDEIYSRRLREFIKQPMQRMVLEIPFFHCIYFSLRRL